jgi:diguanylate cyclase (GGDEF)-like protein
VALPRQRWRYGLTGAALALGAPGGLLLLRGLVAGELLRPAWVVAEVGREAWLYLYLLVSTAFVFALFGFTLGRGAERLAELSISDPLTGLLNARVLAERLEAECARAARYGEPLSLLFIDVDGLKQLNDGMGHAAGDAALQAVASAVRQCSRGSDIAARWGGDEFSVIAPSTASDAALRMAERIRSAATQAAARAGLAVTVSVGAATSTAGACSADRLRSCADDALYEAKGGGRNCVRVGHVHDAPTMRLV